MKNGFIKSEVPKIFSDYWPNEHKVDAPNYFEYMLDKMTAPFFSCHSRRILVLQNNPRFSSYHPRYDHPRRQAFASTTDNTVLILIQNMLWTFSALLIFWSHPWKLPKLPIYHNVPLFALFVLNVMASTAFFFITPHMTDALSMEPISISLQQFPLPSLHLPSSLMLSISGGYMPVCHNNLNLWHIFDVYHNPLFD